MNKPRKKDAASKLPPARGRSHLLSSTALRPLSPSFWSHSSSTCLQGSTDLRARCSYTIHHQGWQAKNVLRELGMTLIVMPCVGGRCLSKRCFQERCLKDATYLHFQNKAVTSDFGDSLALSLGAICSEGEGQSGPFAAPLCGFSDGEAPRHAAQSTGVSLGI